MGQHIDTSKLCMGCMKSIENKKAPCPHCGWQDDAAERAPHHLPLYTILNGKYLVGRVLGEGGFGITYLGWDLNLDMKVAIKEYYPSGFVTRETTATTTVTPLSGEKREAYFNGLEKFVNEAKSLAKFSSLPGVVSVKDFFRENGTGYIVMEYVEGITLKQYLKKEGGRLPINQVLQLVKPLIKSLTQMHEIGIIHRDISPDNIMLTSGGEVKLLDFGAARDISTDGADIHISEVKSGCFEAFLLCTDGFWEYVFENEMEIDLAKSDSPEKWIRFMTWRLSRRVSGTNDNFTALAVFIDTTDLMYEISCTQL